MKRLFSVLCICAMMLTMLPAMAMTASAEVEGDFVYFVLSDGTVEIADYTGLAIDLVIPSMIDGYTVTSIGYSAFQYCNSFQSVTIGNGVTSIGDYAFSWCESLTSITIPNSVASIGEYAFAYSALKNMMVPNGVTSIGRNAFCRCPWLTSVTIGNSVTSIENGAFYNCYSLESITIGGSVTSIGNGAFYDCYSLESVSMGNSVTSIGEDAFLGCSSLKSIAIPNSVTSIGEYAFCRCLSLESITIPSSVTSIGERAFACCSLLANVIISDSVTNIGDMAFDGCHSLSSIIVPSNVTGVGSGLFRDCSSLVSVTIPKGVTSIGEGTFNGCDLLTDVYFGGSKDEWNRISIGGHNSPLMLATIHCANYATITSESATVAYAKRGEKASVTVDAVGDGLTYTWYYRNASGTKYSKSSFTSNTYSVVMKDAPKDRRVYCVVKDKYGNTAQSKTFLLREAASVTSESATAAYAKMGEKVSVTVGAAGDGLTYTWYIKNANATKYSKSAVTSPTYAVPMSNTVKGRRVYCVVKDKYGKTARSKTFILREAVSITSESATAAYAKMGQKATVTVGAAGDGLTYTWYYRNANGTKYSKSSFTSNTYSVVMKDAPKDRRVYCVVRDKYGNTAQSKTFLLREAVSITTQPKTTTTAKGAIAKTTVKASGDGLTYTWYIKNAGQTGFSKSSVTKATYSTTMTDKSKNRSVYCVVKDKYGKTVKSATVQLKMK